MTILVDDKGVRIENDDLEDGEIEQEEPALSDEDEYDEDDEGEEYEEDEDDEGEEYEGDEFDEDDLLLEDDEFDDHAGDDSAALDLMESVLTTEDGETVASALVNIGRQLEMQNKILIKIFSTLQG